MADKKEPLCVMIDRQLSTRVCGRSRSNPAKHSANIVEQLITDYYNMKENTKMTGDMRTIGNPASGRTLRAAEGIPQEKQASNRSSSSSD